jgi:hypothetical protein
MVGGAAAHARLDVAGETQRRRAELVEQPLAPTFEDSLGRVALHHFGSGSGSASSARSSSPSSS